MKKLGFNLIYSPIIKENVTKLIKLDVNRANYQLYFETFPKMDYEWFEKHAKNVYKLEDIKHVDDETDKWVKIKWFIYVCLNRCGLNTREMFDKFENYSIEDKVKIIDNVDGLSNVYKYFRNHIKSQYLTCEEIESKYKCYVNQVYIDKINNKSTVDQEQTTKTCNQLQLFIYLREYINNNDGKMIIEEFSTYLKNTLSKS